MMRGHSLVYLSFSVMSLMNMAERSARGKDRTMELNVHKENEDARDYYEVKCGFVRFGETADKVAWVMRRKLCL